VGILRRKRLPERLAACFAAFRRVERDVQEARAVLSKAAPTARLPGLPLAEVLSEFEERLGRAHAAMDAWRAPELEAPWRACAEGIARARAMGERVRLEAGAPAGFEALIGLLEELSAPLDVFEDAQRAFRGLRVRSTHPSGLRGTKRPRTG
jgi:hypothetical protein